MGQIFETLTENEPLKCSASYLMPWKIRSSIQLKAWSNINCLFTRQTYTLCIWRYAPGILRYIGTEESYTWSTMKYGSEYIHNHALETSCLVYRFQHGIYLVVSWLTFSRDKRIYKLCITTSQYWWWPFVAYRFCITLEYTFKYKYLYVQNTWTFSWIAIKRESYPSMYFVFTKISSRNTDEAYQSTFATWAHSQYCAFI